MKLFPSFWQHRSFLSYLLLPFSLLYRLVIFIRRGCYRLGFKKTTHFNVPVIVVGNITVGGTGKTPLVIWLANFLKTKGYRPGIISRGYGATTKNFPFLVDVHNDASVVGDEAVLMVRHAQCAVVIDPNRARAAKYLLSQTDCNVILSDDGLQHYALGRDIEMIVLDAERGLSNGFCLPAGPLRESRQRLQAVDFVVVNGLPVHPIKALGVAARVEFMRLLPTAFHQVGQSSHTQLISSFKNKVIHAVAGIGNPSRFFNTLRELGLTVVEHAFPDHYVFQASDFIFGANAIIVMTEKDAVKCEKFATPNMWYLAVHAEFDPVFGEQLEQVLIGQVKI